MANTEITTLENNIDNVFNLLLVEFKNHNVTVYGTWEEPLFKAKDIGDMLGIAKIRDTISKFEKTMIQRKICDAGTTGGANTNKDSNMARVQEQYFLTEEGLYELLSISKKDMAKEFRRYIFEILKQQRLSYGKKYKDKFQQLMIQNKQDKEQTEQDKNQHSKDNENNLITAFHRRNIVYVVVVEEDCDSMIIKFGYTDDIKDRMLTHRRTYKGCYLKSVFGVLRNRQFEQHILNLTNEWNVKYDKVPTGKEHLKLNKNGIKLSYDDLINMIQSSIEEYNNDIDSLLQSLYRENTNLKQKNIELEMNIVNLKEISYLKGRLIEQSIAILPPSYQDTFTSFISQRSELSRQEPTQEQIQELLLQAPTQEPVQEPIQEQVQEPIQEEIQEKIHIGETKVSKGPFVQKINKDTFEIISVYNNIIEAIRQNEEDDVKESLLKTSVAKRFVYKGYRWFFVDRKSDPKIKYDIGSNVLNENTKRYCNTVKIDKGQLIDAYSSQQKAAEKNNVAKSTIYDYLKNRNVLNGGVLYLDNNLPENLKHLKQQIDAIIAEERKNEPKYYKMDGDVIIRSYPTLTELYKIEKTSSRVIKRVLNTSEKVKGGYTYVYK